tara:strand:- start:170 stop:556 length:387 start_codon:yes stop_codon:yes gene_type:complete
VARVSCKPSVRFKGFTRGLVRILVAVQRVAERTRSVGEVVITSANDGKHSQRPRSRHYTDEAIDLRSRNFQTADARDRFLVRLREELGGRFYVAYEGHGKPSAHIHVQPRRGTVWRGGLCGERRESRA